MEKVRCTWACHSESEQVYHDTEWGIPQHDDQKLFELLVLEGMQAGLSWSTILNKRDHMARVFDGFDPNIIVNYQEDKLNELLIDPGIIRNRLKINSLVINAKAFLEVQEEFGSFNEYIWAFVNHEPIHNTWEAIEEVPASTPLSDQISKELKKRGFKFIGSTIIYAYMQAIGMVNDHLVSCYRYHEVK